MLLPVRRFVFDWGAAPPASTGKVKIWTGSAWAEKPVKIWNGSAWVIKPAKFWNGSQWVTTKY